jgi:hypothetical protein
LTSTGTANNADAEPNLTFNGVVLSVGSAGVSTADLALDIGAGRTGNGYSFIDLVGDTTYNDYGLRLIRGNSGANSTSQLVHRGTGPLEILTLDAGPLSLATAASSRMYIKATGEVGIGTTNPLATFQVGLSSALTNYQGAPVGVVIPDGGGSWIELAENTTSGTSFRISAAGASETIMFNANARGLGFRAAGYSTALTDAQMVLTTAGNVGIGITNPTNTLHVSGTVRLSAGENIWIGNNTDSGDRLRLHQSGNSGYIDWGAGTLNFRSGATSSDTRASIDGSGNLIAAGNITAFGSPSDIRFKHNIKPIGNALASINKLQGVTFNWNEDTTAYTITKLTDDIGFIAQQVREVLPQLVREGEDGYLGIRERALIPLLVEAIKELKHEIDILKVNK